MAGARVISKASSDTGMAGDTAYWLGHLNWLVTQKTYNCLSVWSGIPESMEAKFQKRKSKAEAVSPYDLALEIMSLLQPLPLHSICEK